MSYTLMILDLNRTPSAAQIHEALEAGEAGIGGAAAPTDRQADRLRRRRNE